MPYSPDKSMERGAIRRDKLEAIQRCLYRLMDDEDIERDHVKTYLPIFITLYLMGPDLITQFLFPIGVHIPKIRDFFYSAVAEIKAFACNGEEAKLMLATWLQELAGLIISPIEGDYHRLESDDPGVYTKPPPQEA